ncbi:MAG: hypothetical protein LAP38_07295, partial [Acidobacteriia bacterium]|nr:hypothetical protein [Terriglobia bacterium]
GLQRFTTFQRNATHKVGLRKGMTGNIKQEFFEFDDFGSNATARLPPPVGIECGVVRGLNRDARWVAFHGAPKDAAEPSRVVGRRHHHDRAIMVLVAPDRKHFPLFLASGRTSWDSLHVVDAKRLELASGNLGNILVGNSAAEKLAVHDAVRGIGENRDARRHALVDQVGRLERPGAIGINGNDDDVGGLDGELVQNKCPSGRPQNLRPNRRYANGNQARQHDNR